ncbi:hypothetical protein BC937DRAFT_88397 [Endogone sp. FLAS-F59071]|nr:hypothetical protein BC937DRAFT_88397 [Endogone sp. FLAS-F59071]|eukprot:RUS18746.1 hypothetical protein BC937DRAFT_88397 [Endogone sp. FLAS-F59071]
MPATTNPRLLHLVPNRDHLNSKFEGYKLALFRDDTHLHRTLIPDPGIHVPKIANSTRLSFRELEARVTFNHLAAGYDFDGRGIAFYVNATNTVTMIQFDHATNATTFHPLVELPVGSNTLPSYVEPDSSTNYYPQYPTIRALSPFLLLVSDGTGHLHVVYHPPNPTTDPRRGRIILTMSYNGDGTEGVKPVPCVLLDAKLVDGEDSGSGSGTELLFAVYSIATQTGLSKEEEAVALSSSSSSQSRSTIAEQAKRTLFNIVLLSLPLPFNTDAIPTSANLPNLNPTVLHTLRGPDIPCYFSLDPTGASYVIGSEYPFELVLTTPTSMDLDPTPIPVSTLTPASYTWTQTTTDLTLHFSLPPGTPSTAVHCHFTTSHLSLLVDGSSPDAPPLLSHPYHALYHPFDPSASLWTLETRTGELTLHLQKQQPSAARWPHVFAYDDGVIEDLDPSNVREAVERLERFTSSEEEGGAGAGVGAGVGPGAGRPFIVGDADVDEEDVDHEARGTILAWVDRSGRITVRTGAGTGEWICGAFERPGEEMPPVCLKHDVDGLWRLNANGGTSESIPRRGLQWW